MALTSPSFLLFAIIVVLVSRAVRATVAQDWVLCLSSTLFLLSYVDRPFALLPWLAFLVFAYALVELQRRTRSPLLLVASIGWLVAVFVWLKRYAFVPAALTLPFPYATVGLSYALFRLLHLMIDTAQGEPVRTPSPLRFFNYVAGFLTLSAGPIQRYEDFEQQAELRVEPSASQVFEDVRRVVHGLVKVAVISAIFDYFFTALSARVLDASAPLHGPWLVASYGLCALCYTTFLYSNFAGYMDIVLGVGSLMGYRFPENFKRPFRATSFLEFWSRWHITLSEWFRTYLFNPLLQALARRVTSPRLSPYLAVFAFFVTFMLMGLWHGATRVFVVYGLLMGAGASGNKLWQLTASKAFGKQRYKALTQRAAVVYLSRGLVFAYFALSLTCLWLSLPELVTLAGRLGVAGLMGCYAGLVGAGSLALLATDFVVEHWPRLLAKSEPLAGTAVLPNLALAAQVLLISSVGSFFHKAPEFVYRAF